MRVSSRLSRGGHKALDKVASFLPDMVGRFKTLVDDVATMTQYQADKERGRRKALVCGKMTLTHPADAAEGCLQRDTKRE